MDLPSAPATSVAPRRPLAGTTPCEAEAVVLHGDRSVGLGRFGLKELSATDLLIETEATGISSGTEKLFWSGDMPPFPGMGYPLVPGYESVGRVVRAPEGSALLGRRVFVPGSYSFEDVHCLFGGAASRIVAPEARVIDADDLEPEEAIILSLAATALHAIAQGDPPDLIAGFGVLGRLLFRITEALGHPAPQVWETNPARARAEGIIATTSENDRHTPYRTIYDATGNAGLIDRLVAGLEKRGTLVLAGFYPGRVGFDFAPAFQKEARLRIAAEWSPGDLQAVRSLMAEGRLSLSGLVSHSMPWRKAPAAYDAAFTDPDCLKMILDWRIA